MEILKNVISELKQQLKISVYHHYSPNNRDFPNIVYSVISDTPGLHGDDKELNSNITIRLYVITKDGVYYELQKAINNIMVNLGFSRGQSAELTQDSYKVKTLDFKISI
ncbi:hypothetical protein SAMN02745671_02560 [Anaerovibrio lipolyticus DSM 3074]|uniref:DUF3168 domain-containing protein n=1 Tax=Anaerovibrio lipolyticus DSM 3074 TaxID=1120997 RepID=A0A1M6G7W9_9FIRM|nr:hypothetical protein [Anaerovibrio lipolyticus]SHJ06063.1 hypothetical protein SAMN02745671_02560 [Anaerovibrio lipolyticus DSM 3074]